MQPNYLLKIMPLPFVLATLLSALAATPPTGVQIDGTVTTSEDIPLVDVRIRLWRAGIICGEATTNGKGQFLLRFGPDKVIDAITFEPPDPRFYGPTVIENLSGARNQQLNIIAFEPKHFSALLQRGSNKAGTDLSPIRRQLTAILQLIELESALPDSAEAEPLRFREFVHRMRYDQALYGSNEAAEVAGYLDAIETRLQRKSDANARKYCKPANNMGLLRGNDRAWIAILSF